MFACLAVTELDAARQDLVLDSACSLSSGGTLDSESGDMFPYLDANTDRCVYVS